MRTAILMLFGFTLPAACGDQHPGTGTDADTTPADANVIAVAKCGQTPREIVDGRTFVPAGGVTAVVTPQIAVAGDYLYYNLQYVAINSETQPPTGSILRVRLDAQGAQPQTLVTSAQPNYFDIVGDTVYFGDSFAGGIHDVPIGGGSAGMIAPASSPGWITHDQTSLYFVDASGIDSAPLAGGSGAHVTDSEVFSFSSIGGDLVLADFSGDAVSSLPLSGGSATPLATGQDGPLYPVTCGTATCWLDAGDQSNAVGVVMTSSPGGATPLATDGRLFRPHGVASDATHLFVTAEGVAGPSISRVAIGSGELDTIATPASSGDVVVDDQCAYWSSLDGLWSIAKDAPALAQ